MTATRTAILELRGAGHGVSEIARRLGLAQSTIHHHLRAVAAADESPARVDPVSESVDVSSTVATRHRVRELLDAGIGRAEVARRLGVSKSTVSYHARRLGEPIDTRCARRYDWVAVQAFHDAGHGARACIRAFGFSSHTWHAAIVRGDLIARSPFLAVDEMFAAGTPRARSHLKKRLFALGLRRPECECCGLTEWRDAPISLALHHVNGRRDDNRLENLQLLCPNCHSQTDNFAGRQRGGGGSR